MPTQTKDISGDPNAITYAAPGLTWKVAKGVDVVGQEKAVSSVYASSKLINQGNLAGGSFGVNFNPGNTFGTYSVENAASGAIAGQYGVYVTGAFLGSLDVTNAGDISGVIYGIYASGSSAVDVENSGHVFGGVRGVIIAAASVGARGPVVDNFGTIESTENAVFFATPGGVLAKLVNHSGGVLKAGVLAVESSSQLNFKNEGKVEGAVETSTYDDKIINKKVIKGDLLLNQGDDVFKNKGKAKAGLIDTGDGNDLVALGDKADKLLFDSALNAATNVDTVKNFASGKDAIYLDDDIFTTIAPGTLSSGAFHKGTSAADADDRIIYDKASGALYYDPDGLGGVAQTQFARFEGGTKLKAADFTVGEHSFVL